MLSDDTLRKLAEQRARRKNAGDGRPWEGLAAHILAAFRNPDDRAKREISEECKLAGLPDPFHKRSRGKPTGTRPGFTAGPRIDDRKLIASYTPHARKCRCEPPRALACPALLPSSFGGRSEELEAREWPDCYTWAVSLGTPIAETAERCAGGDPVSHDALAIEAEEEAERGMMGFLEVAGEAGKKNAVYVARVRELYARKLAQWAAEVSRV